jgi:hypothetical protein
MLKISPILLSPLVTLYLLGCGTTETGLKPVDEKPGQCGEVPIGVSANKNDLDLAGAQIGDFSLGKLTINFSPEFHRVVSDAATNDLVQDYIRCKAIARAGVHSDPTMVDYFMRLSHFLSRERTVDEQIKWRKANPFPKKQGKLELSGPEYVGADKKRVFQFSDKTPQRVMGVINAGEGPLTWWYDYFPSDYFYSDFHPGDKKTLMPKDNISVVLILKGANPKRKNHRFAVKADNDEEVVVELEITGSPYKLLSQELNKRLLANSERFSDLIDNSLIIKQASNLVEEEFSKASGSSKQFLVSQILLTANFPYAAFTYVRANQGQTLASHDPSEPTLLDKDLEKVAEVDLGIQHLKWAVWKQQQGNSEEVAIHTEQAYKAVTTNYRVPEKTKSSLKEAKEDARKGNTQTSASMAWGIIDELSKASTIEPSDPAWASSMVTEGRSANAVPVGGK